MTVFQVRVLTGDHDALASGRPTHVHLVDVLAESPSEAELIACQMAAAVLPDGVPMSSEVLTDSEIW